MKYHKIDSKLFVKNRKNFMSKMRKNSIAFFNSNDIYPVSADSTLPFEQHRDIFYLSGIDQEESVLMLHPNASDPNHREVLFLKETDDQKFLSFFHLRHLVSLPKTFLQKHKQGLKLT